MKKLKSLISVTLILSIALSIVGCKPKETSEPVSKEAGKVSTSTKTEPAKPAKNYEDFENFNSPTGMGYLLYFPSAYFHQGTSGEADTARYKGASIMGVEWNDWSKDKFKIKLENIKSNDQVLEGMTNQIFENSKDRKMEITKKENVKVNGFDMCKYTGYIIRDGKPSKNYFVGYGFIFKERPYCFIAFDWSDSQKYNADVNELIDKVSRTFHYKED